MKKILLKSILALTSLALFSTISCSSGDDSSSSPISTTPTTTPTVDVSTLETLSSIDFAKQLVVGWNLGNTFDAGKELATSDKGDTETSWGMPKTTKAMIDAVAKKGFKTIRIPVSWHNHITDATNLTINPTWMNRVKEVVDWAIADDMFVILNIHHDDFKENQTTYGYSVSTNEAEKTKAKKYFTKIWTQVGTTFKDYDLRLVFEVLNEPRYITDDNNDGFSPTNEQKSTYNGVIKEYEQVCVDTIRATGGNNTKRFLMCPAYAASPWHLENWSLPTDSADNKLLASIHAYDPYDFAMGTLANSTFTDSIKSALDNEIKTHIKNKFIDKGIGAVIGETSVTDKNNDSERLKWIECYFSNAKSVGIPVVLWDNMKNFADSGYVHEKHGWFNRNSLTWYHESLVDKMISCSK